MEQLFNNIISKRVFTILETINKSYPDKFKKTDIKKEHAILMQHIKFNNTHCDISKNETKQKTIPEQKGKYKLKKLKRIEFKKVIKSIPDSIKCNARVWSNHIISIKTGKKVNKIDEEFMGSDYRRLDVDEFLKKYKIGNRCKNKKIDDGKYCTLHSEHLVHGDFSEKPSKEICFHFIKDAKF